MPILISFKKRIKELIDDTGLKNNEIVKAGKFDSRSLSIALNYGIVPRTSTLIKMANFFNVSVNYLLGRTDINDFIPSVSGAAFKTRFDELCIENNKSRYKVAKECCFDKSNISGWISKGYQPTLEILDLLTEYFGVSPDYLLGRSDYRR